jgi:putative ABC transport system permease protein
VSLALGIGASTAIFSVVNAVLLRPLPYPAPERLMWISAFSAKKQIDKMVVSYPDFHDWRQQAQSFESIAGFVDSTAVLGGNTGEPERLVAAGVLGDFFAVLGIEPVLGRKFVPAENEVANSRVTILSHALWQRRFGGDPAIVGGQITLNGNAYTVVGVMPAGLRDPAAHTAGRPVELWLPVGVVEKMRTSRRNNFISVIGRLKPGVSVEAAGAELKAIAAGLEQQYPDTNTGWSVAVDPLHERLTADVRPALLVLSGAVAFLLLIACANVANLLLARATTRQREIAVRAALGASRGQIVRQLLTENVLLSLAAGAAGLLLASWGISALLALSPGNIPRLDTVRLDAQVLMFTIAVSLVTGLLFGLAPALAVSKLNLNDTLKEAGRSASAGAGGRRLRNVLTVAQIALSLMLLAGAGLLIRSFIRLQDVTPGFNPNNLLAAELSLPPTIRGEPASGELLRPASRAPGRAAGDRRRGAHDDAAAGGAGRANHVLRRGQAGRAD